MLETLEVYSRDLEKQIEAKRTQYEAERKRADSINFKLLPPTVALNLKYNPLRYDILNIMTSKSNMTSYDVHDVCINYSLTLI